MKALELKLVPDVVLLLIGGGMWLASRLTPSLELPLALRIAVAAVLLVIGLGIVQMAGREFRQAATTVDPAWPDAASALVVSGIYRRTRNPIYLGMAVVLIAWAAFLANLPALALVFVFVLYITRFQIVPEERALSARFGAAYAAYKAQVRRWM